MTSETAIQTSSVNINELQDQRPFTDWLDQDELTTLPDLDSLRVPETLSRATSSSSLRVPSPSLSSCSSSSSLKRSRSPSPTVPEAGSDSRPGQSSANARRRKRRKAKLDLGLLTLQGSYSSALEKHVFNSDSVPSPSSDLEALDRPFDNPTLRSWAQRPFKVQDLTGPEMGFSVVPWDGQKSKMIHDCKGKLLAVLAGRPAGEDYLKAAEEAHKLLMEQGEAYHKLEKGKGKGKDQNRRGDFVAMNFGLTHGNGTTEPVNLSVKSKFRPIVDRLLSDKNVQRLAGNMSGVVRAWAPQFHVAVEEAVRKVLERDSKLWKPFQGSVYPTCAFNFGPKAWCYIHRDGLNVTNGYCAIQALGRYDPAKGGHLVLWDLKKALEFPPGSTVLIMSSLLFHSSLGVGPGEERSVMTQYCPEGILRYANNGLKTDKQLCQDLGEDQRVFAKRLQKERKESGLMMVPTKDM